MISPIDVIEMAASDEDCYVRGGFKSAIIDVLPVNRDILVAARISEVFHELFGNFFPGPMLISYLCKKKIPAEVLGFYRLALNFHPAPLPDYRGFAPYTFGILNGETKWGVTCHHMTAEIDAGPIVEVRRFPIEDPENVTALSLRDQTIPHLARLFRDVMERVARGEELPKLANEGGRYYTKEQFESRRTYWPEGFDLDQATRAFWCPPYAGFELYEHTLAPRCVAGGRG